MNPHTRRSLITFIVMLVAGMVVSVVLFPPNPRKIGSPNPADQAAQPDPNADSLDDSNAADDADRAEGEAAEDASPTTDDASRTADDTQSDADPGDEEPSPAPKPADAGPTADSSSLGELHATASDRVMNDPRKATQSLGSLDREKAKMLIEFSAVGAGMKKITFSDIWLTSRSHRQILAHRKAVAAGKLSPPPMPGDEMRYVLQTSLPLTWTSSVTGQLQVTDVPVLAAHSIIIDGQTINLTNAECWTEIAPGEFESIILNDRGEKILTINRKFSLVDDFGLTLEQHLTNHTDAELNIIWRQYGPGDLTVDLARYIDRRRFRFGYLQKPQADPNREFVFLDNKMIFERESLQRKYKKVLAGRYSAREHAEAITLWPNPKSTKSGYELSSFASTNRYFGLAVHPRLDDQGRGPRTFSDVVDKIVFTSNNPEGDEPSIFTYLYSPPHTIAPGATLDLDMGVYAGPLDHHAFENNPRYEALKLQGLILYQMSSMCAICTFQWLADFLYWFLSFVDAILHDWAMAIILLVIVVRTILHPITKKSQINMRLFSEQMQSMKPEIDKLQKKYPNDPKKLQQEQMRFMRENNINPATAAFGCMPMFLQMPIWVALYAMLYFAFDLRHEAGFYGIFQMFSGWPFLADLSAADHFFGAFDQPRKFLLWNLTGINLLPILMGVIFFFQQKYMTPPPSPSMTKEQIQQQKIMKWMMVVLFPLMLYSAPSGLTLYILTSTAIGIVEAKYIRSHINDMDLKKASGGPKAGNPRDRRKKPKDPQGRAFSDALERAKAKRKGPEKKFKKKK